MERRSRFKVSHGLAPPVAVMIVALTVMAVAASSTSAYIYVGGPITSWQPKPSTIERRTNDGSAVQPNYIDGPRVESARQLVVDGDRIYWLDSSTGDCRVGSASLDGTDVRTLATLSSGRCGSWYSMALADRHLYWNNEPFNGEMTIGRLSLSPPYTVQPDYIHVPPVGGTVGEATHLVAAAPWLYWMDPTHDTVGRAREDGSNVDPALFTVRTARLLGVADGHLWWQDGRGAGSIGRARLDGSDVEPSYLTGIQLYDGALTSRWLYYTGSACNPPGCVDVDGMVRRVALEPGAKPEFVAGGLGEGAGSSIAVDSLGDPFPKVRIRKHGDGTATALVSTPRRARVSVRGERILHATAKGRHTKVARVAIRPRQATKRVLRRRGAAHVSVRLAYRPVAGLPRSDRRSLKLRLTGRR
jgi:hypothetical protein